MLVAQYIKMDNSREYAFNQLHNLALTANTQYLDLESTEEELNAWVRNARRGSNVAQAFGEPSLRSGQSPVPHPQNWHLIHSRPHAIHSVTMYEQPEAQYSYHDESTHAQSFYPPPPADPHSPYYPNHPNNFPQVHSEQENSQRAAYGYSPQYPSNSPLSPSSSSTDPELKRIRNTAASARFRAKKKRREASLERSAKEKREALEKLETRIRELEAENKFLKGLIFDKEKLDSVKTELEKARVLERDLVRDLERGLDRDIDVGKEEGERDDGVGTSR